MLITPWKTSKTAKAKNKVEREKAKAGYLASIAFKCNLKMGGTNYKLGDSSYSFLSEESILFIGIHVAWPGSKNDPCKESLVGVVSNINQQFAQWPGTIHSQDKADTVRGISDLVEQRVKLFVVKNKKSPTKVIIYRHVEPNGGYQDILQKEIPEIGKALRTCRAERPPQLTVIAVSPSGGQFGTKINGNAKDKDNFEINGSQKAKSEPASKQGTNDSFSIVKPSDYNPTSSLIIDRPQADPGLKSWDFVLRAGNEHGGAVNDTLRSSFLKSSLTSM